MKVSNRTLILILALIVIFSVFACIVGMRIGENNESIARIYLDGSVFTVLDLSKTAEPYILEVGSGNSVLVEPGCISMHDANCADKLCIKSGRVSSAHLPIVCLPNKVVIIIEPSGTSREIDAVSE